MPAALSRAFAWIYGGRGGGGARHPETVRKLAALRVASDRVRRDLDGHYVGVRRFIDHITKGTAFRAPGIAGQRVTEVMGRISEQMESRNRDVAVALVSADGVVTP